MDRFDKRWNDHAKRMDQAQKMVGFIALGVFALWAGAVIGICWLAYKVLVHFGIL